MQLNAITKSMQRLDSVGERKTCLNCYSKYLFLMSYAACYIKEIYVVVIISDREFSLPEPSAKQIANRKNSFPPLQIPGRGIILEVDP
jgi:hypothetical protein